MTIKDEVLPDVIDIDSGAAPTIERDRPSRLWERDNWSVSELDFTRDAVEWREQLSEQHKRAIRWSYAL